MNYPGKSEKKNYPKIYSVLSKDPFYIPALKHTTKRYKVCTHCWPIARFEIILGARICCSSVWKCVYTFAIWNKIGNKLLTCPEIREYTFGWFTVTRAVTTGGDCDNVLAGRQGQLMWCLYCVKVAAHCLVNTIGSLICISVGDYQVVILEAGSGWAVPDSLAGRSGHYRTSQPWSVDGCKCIGTNRHDIIYLC